MGIYLLNRDNAGRPSGYDLACLDDQTDSVTHIYDIHEISVSLGKDNAVVIIDQSSLSKDETLDAIQYCKTAQIKSLLLIDESVLAHVDYLHLLDDFSLLPVQKVELAARVKRLVGNSGEEIDHSIIRLNDLYVDLAKYDVFVGSRKVTLTYKEFQLLVALAASPGHVFSREDLLSRVWGYDYLGGTRTVDVHIRRLRSKIEDASHVFVETVWNVGYRFNVED